MRVIEGWLKFNPIAVLLLFPLIATPARFAKSQRNGIVASLLATGALLLTAADYWASAMQELAAMGLRHAGAAYAGSLNEVAKQQFEVYLGAVLSKPMTFAVAATIFMVGCCRAAWYRSFIAIYHRSRKQRPVVGLHYFLVQSASGGLYLGVLTYFVCFGVNNWAWIEQPTLWLITSGYVLAPILAFGLVQRRYLTHKARVDRQLYGSWVAELASAVSALLATVVIGCVFTWLLGLILGRSGAV